MKDSMRGVYHSRIQAEIRLHIETIDMFSNVKTQHSRTKREYIGLYTTKIQELLKLLQAVTTHFEFAKFVTSDEKIYNINLEMQTQFTQEYISIVD